MRTTLPSALVTIAVLGAAAGAGAEDAAKVAVVAFAPLTGEVPNNAGAKATEVLLTALKGHDNLAAQDASGGAGEDPAAHAKKAEELLATARTSLEGGQPYAAKKTLQTALTELTAGAASLDGVEMLADIEASLARACYQSGDDTGGAQALDAAEAVHPGREFPEIRSSALFAGLAAKAKDRVLGTKGSLQINSVPSGATARIDGLEAGKTPVLVQDLPAGPHAWRVELPSGQSVGGIVEVKAQHKGAVSGAAAGSGPAAGLVGLVVTNTLGPDSLQAMKDAAAGLEVAYLVFGGLHVDGGDLVLDAFVYSAKAHAFARLPQAKFDADLVSAGQSLTALANDVAGRAAAGQLGAASKVPTKVSDSVGAGESAELTEFRFPAPGVEAKPKTESGPRKVIGARHGPVTK